MMGQLQHNHFVWQNPNWNQTWYDDSLSISKKYDLALSKNLGGIGIWALGYDEGYDELWNLLKNKMAAKRPKLTNEYLLSLIPT